MDWTIPLIKIQDSWIDIMLAKNLQDLYLLRGLQAFWRPGAV